MSGSFFNSEDVGAMQQSILQAMSDAQGKLQIPHIPAGTLAVEGGPIPVPGVVLQLVLTLMQKSMIQNATLLLMENTLDTIVSNLPEEQQEAIKAHLQEVTEANIEQIKENAKKAKEEANKQKIALPKGPIPKNLRGPNGRL